MASMQLATQVMGEGSDIVLIHGWGMNSGVWCDVVDQLAAHARVTCIDLPGHGQSPVEAVDDLDGWVDAVLEVAPDKASWVGWSLGGLIATQCALHAPERVSRLVLVASTPRFLRDEDWPEGMQDEVFDLFAAELERDSQSAWQRFLALQLRGAPDYKSQLRRLRALLENRGAPTLEGLRQGLKILRTTDLRSRLASVSCPVEAIYGARDTLVTKACHQAIRALNPQIKETVFPDTGHAPFLSDADQFSLSLRSAHG